MATDLDRPVAGKICDTSAMSPITSLHTPLLQATLANDYALAMLETTDPTTLYSTSPRFTWAEAAKLQCSIALGYMRTGTIDTESASKCDCFTQHIVNFR
ncbi:MAG TPA: hypothetical protein VL418_04910 [Devosiaceae bacterium]|nr:hypothetical protein [Devosiaceae bacterium]